MLIGLGCDLVILAIDAEGHGACIRWEVPAWRLSSSWLMSQALRAMHTTVARTNNLLYMKILYGRKKQLTSLDLYSSAEGKYLIKRKLFALKHKPLTKSKLSDDLLQRGAPFSQRLI